MIHNMFNENEIFTACPYCYQSISFLVEDLYGAQSYVEDCEVCCQPIEIKYQINDSRQITNFQAEKAY